MNIEQLRQYRYLIIETALIDKQIEDINNGASIGNDEIKNILLQRKTNCLTAIQNIEDWIVAIPDIVVQKFIIMHCLDGLSFTEIAHQKRSKPDTVRKSVYRAITTYSDILLHNT